MALTYPSLERASRARKSGIVDRYAVRWRFALRGYRSREKSRELSLLERLPVPRKWGEAALFGAALETQPSLRHTRPKHDAVFELPPAVVIRIDRSLPFAAFDVGSRLHRPDIPDAA